MLAREPKSLLKVVVLQFSSGLQEELWQLELGEEPPQISPLSALSVVALGSVGVPSLGDAGFSPAVVSAFSTVVEQSWGRDVSAAEAAGACPGSWAAPPVVRGGLHVSSVRSMMVRLLHGAASVLVSSQVRSMISCGDRGASAVSDGGNGVLRSFSARSFCYGGTVIPAHGGKGAHWHQPRKRNQGQRPQGGVLPGQGDEAAGWAAILSSSVSLPQQHS